MLWNPLILTSETKQCTFGLIGQNLDFPFVGVAVKVFLSFRDVKVRDLSRYISQTILLYKDEIDLKVV